MQHNHVRLSKRWAAVIASSMVAVCIAAVAAVIHARRPRAAGTASIIELDQRRRQHLQDLLDHRRGQPNHPA